MRTIAVISGKGGVGKTTTAINLSFALTKLGKNVTLVDANLTTPDIGIYLGAPRVPIAIQDVLKGKSNINDATYMHHSGTKIMPSAISLKEIKDVKLNRLNEITSKLKEINDIIILDTPAGLGHETIAAIEAADECLIVTNAELPALTGAMKAISVAKQLNKRIAGIVLTRSNGKNEVHPEDMISLLEYPILSVIPEDSSMKEAVSLREAVFETHPKSKSAKSYEFLAMKILQNSFEKSFIEKIRDFLNI